MRGEVATRAGADGLGERHRNTQCPHGIRLGLLLPGHRQHALVLSGLHQAGRDDGGRSADRARGVHPDQWLAGSADRVGHEQFGHHDALEEVGRLADDDGVDVVERRTRVFECLVDGLAHQAVHRDVLALGDVLGLPGPENRSELSRHATSALQDCDQILLQRRATGGVSQHARRRAIEDVAGGEADAFEPGREHRVGGQRPARRIDLRL